MSLVTINSNYKYEVAFSFLKEDESLAFQIRDLVSDRLSTFIYSEHQDSLVGNDGMNSFSRVFSKEARIVVILYRENWGKTNWTRIEETAIKERVLEESSDFTVVISLDGNKPIWIPKTQIWYDLARYGIIPAAAIIEKKVQEYGGQTREESIKDRAEKHKREISRQKYVENYLHSQKGFKDATEEVNKLLQLVEDNYNEINDPVNDMAFGFTKNPREFSLYAKTFGVTFRWYQPYQNGLLDACLNVFKADRSFYRGPFKPSQILKKIDYRYSLNEANTKGWAKINSKDFMTNDQVIDYWLKLFLEEARIERQKNINS